MKLKRGAAAWATMGASEVVRAKKDKDKGEPEPEQPAQVKPADPTPDPIPTPAPIAGIMEVKGHTGTVVFDGKAVTIIRKGALGRMSIGKGEKRIPVSSIHAVQWKPAGAVMNGFISFTVAGGIEKQSAFGHQTADAAHDENSVVFWKKQQPEFEELRAAVEAVIGQPQQQVVQQAGASVAEQIGQLAALHDQGILTDDEYNTKKAELLSRM